MKQQFKLGLCQILTGSDKPANLERARDAVIDAAKKGAQVVVLPECFNSPYATDQFPIYAETIPPDSNMLSADVHPSTKMLSDVAKETGVYLVGGSIPERDGESIFNTCIVVDPNGQIIVKHRKVHLFDIDVPGKITFKESDTLTAGSGITSFETPFCKIGVAICYDLRFAEQAMVMRNDGCKLLLYPGAFNLTTGPAHWELLLRARALDNQLFVAGVCGARNPDAGYQAWGHTTLVNPWGEVMATTEHGVNVLVADVDPGHADEVRTNIPISFQKRDDLYTISKTEDAPRTQLLSGAPQLGVQLVGSMLTGLAVGMVVSRLALSK